MPLIKTLHHAGESQWPPEKFIHIRLPLKFLHIDATVNDSDTFKFESPDLLLSPGAAHWHCNLAIGPEYPVPRQAAAVWRLRKCSANTSRTAI
jgi:hypothetical protein